MVYLLMFRYCILQGLTQTYAAEKQTDSTDEGMDLSDQEGHRFTWNPATGVNTIAAPKRVTRCRRKINEVDRGRFGDTLPLQLTHCMQSLVEVLESE